jgi:hypothetical protein
MVDPLRVNRRDVDHVSVSAPITATAFGEKLALAPIFSSGFFAAVYLEAKLFAGLKERHLFRGHFHRRAGARVAAGSGVALADRERPETTQLNPSALGERDGNLVENDVDGVLDFGRFERLHLFLKLGYEF